MKKITQTLLIFFYILLLSFKVESQTEGLFKELEGKVIDSNTNNPLIFADIVIKGSNISTVTNTEGEFLLKIPEFFFESIIMISHLGYHKKEIKISEFKNNEILKLEPAITELDVISITTINKDAEALIVEMLRKKAEIYNKNNTLMTAFYRESIKKRKKNASLSEAIVKIHKQSYNSLKKDNIELIKARKNTDYSKLDTLALKLQGGPFSNLYTDIIKYPEYIFNNEDISAYKFSFDKSTRINDKLIYVINFEQKENVITPLYYGKLYIDSETLALTNATYSLNVSNKELTSKMFVKKKPRKVDVYPTEATYRVNYRIKNGQWHYAYSNIALSLKVNWKGKLFNNTYTLNSEMAITDWEINDSSIIHVKNELLRPNTILTDKASGFSDPTFWGAYNIIEPEKSIETAIKKIQKQLNKT